MVDGCKDCKKWAEAMYWSHFQTHQFCQFLSGRFDQHLAIPEKFASNLKEKLVGTVALRGPSGHVWDVGLATNGDTLLLKHGWKEFAEDHSLQENDVLIFKYNGSSRFDVLMFDQDSLCEKASSYFVKKCKHTENESGSKRGGSTEEVFDDTDQSSGDDVDDCPSVKRARSEAGRTAPLRIQPLRFTARGRRGVKRGRRVPRGPYRFHLKSRRREVLPEEKENAQQKAIAAASDNSVIVVMRASHVYSGFFMSIPAEWARKHLPHRSQEVELRTNGNTWKAKYHYKGYGGGLTGGWKNFAMENFLEEFDICLFDRVSGMQDAVVLDVNIFRVVEEVIPPTLVPRPSSTGTRRRSARFSIGSSEEDE